MGLELYDIASPGYLVLLSTDTARLNGTKHSFLRVELGRIWIELIWLQLKEAGFRFQHTADSFLGDRRKVTKEGRNT